MTEHELDILFKLSADLRWRGNQNEKHLGEVLKKLIAQYESACNIAIDCASVLENITEEEAC